MTAIFRVSKFSDFYHITGIWNNLEQKYLSRQYSTNVFEPAHEIIVLITQATSEGSAAQWSMDVDKGFDQNSDI